MRTKIEQCVRYVYVYVKYVIVYDISPYHVSIYLCQ